MGMRRIEGIGAYKVFYTPSTSEPGYLHAVVCLPDRLICDCQSGQAGRQCKHSALARERLIATRQTAPAA